MALNTHYKKFTIDTIQFLTKGFKPEVVQGFFIGSIIKYVHRYENKNGIEDLLKAQDFLNYLIEFEKANDQKNSPE